MTAPVLVLLGSTASGKEAAALHAAAVLGAEIACADSVKPYRGLAIAAAAPGTDAASRVRHHCVGVVEPTERMTAARWCGLAEGALSDAGSRGVPLLFVGGTALYLRAFLFGLFEGPAAQPALRERLRAEEAAAPGTLHARLRSVDPTSAARLHANDVRRVLRAVEVYETTGRSISAAQEQWNGPPRRPYAALGLRRARADLYARIDRRIDAMLAAGLVDEVRALVAEDRLGPTAADAIGVKELLPLLREEVRTGLRDDAALAEAAVRLRRNTRVFARRQDTWWRKFPGVRWIDVAADEPPAETGERIAAHFEEVLASHPAGCPSPGGPATP